MTGYDLDREIGFIFSKHHQSPEKSALLDRFVTLTQTGLPHMAYEKAKG